MTDKKSTSFPIYFFFFSLLVLGNWVLLQGLFDETLAPRFVYVSFFLLLTVIVFFKNFVPSKFGLRPLDGLILLFFLLHLFSSFYAANTSEALFETQKISVLVLTYFLTKFFLLKSYKTAIRALIFFSLLYGFIICLMLYPKIYLLADLYRIDRRMIRSLIGFSGSKNLLSGLLMMLIPFMGMGMFYLKKAWRWISALILVLTLVLIYLLETRSIYLSLTIAGLGGLCVLYFRKKFRRKGWRLAFTAVIPGLLLLTFFVLLGSGSLPELASETGFIKPYSKTGTWLARLEVWERTVPMIKENPILGVGAAQWKLWFPLSGLDGLQKTASQLVYYARPHNDFISVLSELGVIGLVTYVALFLHALYLLVSKIGKAKLRPDFIWIFTGLIAFGIFSFFSFPKERIEFLVLFGIYLALVSVQTKLPGTQITNLFSKNLIVMVAGGVMIFNLILGLNRISVEREAFKKVLAFGKNSTFQSVYVLLEPSWAYNMTPQGVPLSYYNGVRYLNSEYYQKAIQELEEARKINPGLLGTYHNLGVAYFRIKKYDKALSNFKMSLQISSNHPDTNYNLALLYWEQNNAEMSLKYKNRLVDGDPRKSVLEELMQSSSKK